MSWIVVATVGQFLNALVAILDKYIVTDEKALPRPFVYAFYSCLFTGFWFVIFLLSLIPGLDASGLPHLRNVEWPTIQVVGMAFLAAYTFFIALVSMYSALRGADTSDVMPVIGSVSALSSFGMAYLFLDIHVSENFVWGIVLLATGTFLVSRVHFTLDVALHSVHAGIFFALHYIAMKGLFLETSFDDGFFWSRVTFILFGLSLLLVPTYLEKIREQTKKTTTKTGVIVLVAKVCAGVAAFLLLKATDWGDVAVVQALDGLKFIFILLMGLVIGRYTPLSAGENAHDVSTIVRKTVYVIIIALGFIILFV